MSEDTCLVAPSNKLPADFSVFFAEAKRTIGKLAEAGREREIVQCVHNIIKVLTEAGNRCKKLPEMHLMSLVDCCFDFQLQDSRLVVEVLEFLDSFDDMLDEILGNAIQDPRTLSPDQIKQCKQKGLQTFDYLSYLLHHALQRKQTFKDRWFSPRPQKNETTFLPVFAAMKHGSRKTLLTLLQYGFPVITGREWGTDWMFLKSLRKLACLRLAFSGTTVRDKNFASFSENVKDVYRMLGMLLKIQDYFVFIKGVPQDGPIEFRAMFHIIWRAVPHPFVTLNKFPKAVDVDRNCWEYFCTIRRTRILGIYLGYLQPRSLKHLCRCAVWERLHQNWELPYGIKDLNLPSVICKYLNLEID